MRDTKAIINVDDIKYNIRFLRKVAPKSAIAGVVKGNAYGFGIVEISKILRSEKVEFLCVAFPEEGVILRESGDNDQIICLTPCLPEEAQIFLEYNIQPAITNLDFARKINELASKSHKIVYAHLFIDTGMNREGIRHNEALDFMKKMQEFQNINFIGACTHFATSSDNIDFAKAQLSLFKATLAELSSNGFEFTYKHTCNSAGVVNLPEAHFNLIRPGIAIYGYSPALTLKSKFDILPALTLKSSVVQIKNLKKGDTVGYSREYIAEKETNVAIVPIGYADGYLKTLSHKTECLIRGKRYRQIGTICMDFSIFDIGNDNINVGDEVVLIGKQLQEEITPYELAVKASTIHYEILSSISSRVPRIYVNKKNF